MRGRPAGRPTRPQQKAAAFVNARVQKGEPVRIGEGMRVCGFSCRANFKRAMKMAEKNGLLSIN